MPPVTRSQAAAAADMLHIMSAANALHAIKDHIHQENQANHICNRFQNYCCVICFKPYRELYFCPEPNCTGPNEYDCMPCYYSQPKFTQ